ncbi:MAG: VCBS repeat-containing protein [Reichenbachiella sp.]
MIIKQSKYRYCIILFATLVFSVLKQSSEAQIFERAELRDLLNIDRGCGTAVADYDKDGDLDIFLVAFDSYDPSNARTWSKLIENLGLGRIQNSTVEAGFQNQYSNSSVLDNKQGVSWGDYDNDGFPDLALTFDGKIQIYHNQKDGSFKDVTESSNINECIDCYNKSALWFDYDIDGDLDLYISVYKNENKFYVNQGDNTFLEDTEHSNLGDNGASWYTIPFHANDDIYPDLLVLNDFGQSRFYLNEDGQEFREATEKYGLINNGDAMGAAIGDYNNDGNFDIYVTNIAQFHLNPLFTRDESGTYHNNAQAQGIGEGFWGWGTQFFDADCDGDEDLLIANGNPGFRTRNLFYVNMESQGISGFEDRSQTSKLDADEDGMSVETFDFDDDGDLDVLISNTNGYPRLYRYMGPYLGGWLQVELEGTTSNRSAFGTKLQLAIEGKTIHRYYHGSGIMSQSMKPVHFGLGEVSHIDSVMITWPTGIKETIYDININQKIKVLEGNGMVFGNHTPVLDVMNFESSDTVESFPNPFVKEVIISFNAPKTGAIELVIYDLQGSKVWSISKDLIHSGSNEILWKGQRDSGTMCDEGMYIFQLNMFGDLHSGKLIYRSN